MTDEPHEWTLSSETEQHADDLMARLDGITASVADDPVAASQSIGALLPEMFGFLGEVMPGDVGETLMQVVQLSAYMGQLAQAGQWHAALRHRSELEQAADELCRRMAEEVPEAAETFTAMIRGSLVDFVVGQLLAGAGEWAAALPILERVWRAGAEPDATAADDGEDDGPRPDLNRAKLAQSLGVITAEIDVPERAIVYFEAALSAYV